MCRELRSHGENKPLGFLRGASDGSLGVQGPGQNLEDPAFPNHTGAIAPGDLSTRVPEALNVWVTMSGGVPATSIGGGEGEERTQSLRAGGKET